MKKRIYILAVLLCLLTGANVHAQVTISEKTGSEYATIFDALTSVVDDAISPDANGVIHINVSGNVNEPLANTLTATNTVFNVPSSVTKILISSTSDTKHDITTAASANTAARVYKVCFSNASGTLEVQKLRFIGGTVGWIASSTFTGSQKYAKTYFHHCKFANGYSVANTYNALNVNYQSEEFLFENNEFEYGTYYAFYNYNPFKEQEKFIFRENVFCNYRGASIGGDNMASVWKIIEFTNNKFYHQDLFGNYDGTAVCLLQNNGAIYGDYTFEDNKVLGLFTKRDVSSSDKTCALLLQHGTAGYKGIVDGSSITIKDNTLQCDVLEIAFKAGTGTAFESGSVKDVVLDGDYYNILGDDEQTGDYDAVITNNAFVHMYPEKATTHHENDLCHICDACGQMVVRAEVAGHGGSVQYEDNDGVLRDVSTSVVTISQNLYFDDIALGVDLYDKIIYGITRDGFCLDTGDEEELIITPNLPGAFTSLMYYGHTDPADVKDDAETNDGGETYHYTLTNDWSRATPYAACPLLLATLGYSTITVSCEGLSDGESALFDVKDSGGTILYVLNLTSETSSKSISGLAAGTYTVAPHNISGKNWQWTYTMSPTTAQFKEVAIDTDVKYEFTVTKKSGETPLNGESYKDNKFNSDPPLTSINRWRTSNEYDL